MISGFPPEAARTLSPKLGRSTLADAIPIADKARMMHEVTNIASPCGADSMNAEITWDLVMSDDMPFAEGCYRLEGGDWQVVTAVKLGDSHPTCVRQGVRWARGVTGINIFLQDDAKINARVLLAAMSSALGVAEWQEVRGPDSMMLR